MIKQYHHFTMKNYKCQHLNLCLSLDNLKCLDAWAPSQTSATLQTGVISANTSTFITSTLLFFFCCHAQNCCAELLRKNSWGGEKCQYGLDGRCSAGSRSPALRYRRCEGCARAGRGGGDDKRASHESQSYVNRPQVGKSGLWGTRESAMEGEYDAMVMVVPVDMDVDVDAGGSKWGCWEPAQA